MLQRTPDPPQRHHRLLGPRYAEEILDKIKTEKIDNTITFKLFDTANKDFIKKVAKSCESYTMEISPPRPTTTRYGAT